MKIIKYDPDYVNELGLKFSNDLIKFLDYHQLTNKN